MSKRGLSRLAIVSAFAFALAAQAPVAPGAAAGPARAAADEPRHSVGPVQVFGTGADVYGAGSQLARAKEGVFMTLHTQGLLPGTVATAWWVFFNDPKQCATNPCSPADFSNPAVESSVVYAAGRLVGPDGAASYGAFRAVGDTTGANFGPGLLYPKKAEVHLVIRTHGPALLNNPSALAAQLTTFNGGCPPNVCDNIQVSVHQP